MSINPLDLVKATDDIEGESNLTESIKTLSKLIDLDDNFETNPESLSVETMNPKVVNIIAIAEYGIQFDLLDISRRVRNAEYNPKRFKCVTLRIQEPKATGLVFKNGKINIVGCNNTDDSHKAAKKFGRILKNLGYACNRLKEFTISNMVATINCGFSVKISAIGTHPEHGRICTYNPERFSGLVYKLPYPKSTLLIFQSGKAIITGAKSLEDLRNVSEWIYPILKQFKHQELSL